MLRKLKNIFHLGEAFAACIYYGFPGRKMKVIGVTGTSGKTTTSHIIFEALKEAGKNVSMISTVGAYINGKEYDTGFHVTTPKPFAVQKFLKMAFSAGSDVFVIEATSHALDQNRIWGVPVHTAVYTNITHEHLDYHGTYNNYSKAKARLMKNSVFRVLNADDESFDYLKSQPGGKIVEYKKNNLKRLMGKIISPSLPGEFNRYNILAALNALECIGIDERYVFSAVKKFKGIDGRMEKLPNRKGLNLYIDFAHKPDALEKALRTFKKMNGKRLISLFGCAGERDKGKRPMMGKISGRYSDITVITAEDPRREDVNEIISSIAGGLDEAGASELKKASPHPARGGKYYVKIPDRRKAIRFAVGIAKKGDTVVFFGKGHEKSMCFGTTEYPWNEREEVLKALIR